MCVRACVRACVRVCVCVLGGEGIGWEQWWSCLCLLHIVMCAILSLFFMCAAHIFLWRNKTVLDLTCLDVVLRLTLHEASWKSTSDHLAKSPLWPFFLESTRQVLLCGVLAKFPRLMATRLIIIRPARRFMTSPGRRSVFIRVSTSRRWKTDEMPPVRIRLMFLLQCGSFGRWCGTCLIPVAILY